MEHFYSEVHKRNRTLNSESNLNAQSLLRTILSIFLVVLTTTVLFGQTTTYNYTGSVQTFTAPHTGKYLLEVWGAQGGTAGSYAGGLGGYAKGEYTLTAGQTISVYVGQQGLGTSGGTAWNGGGAGICCGAGGGGATDIRIGGTALGNRVIVAGGGGGGSNDTPYGNGGAGGGLSGVQGNDSGSLPGTQVSGYALGVGESNTNDAAGGGGGYYGGFAGGDDSGTGGSGGGGSAYIAGVVSGSTETGIRSGNGMAAVTVLCDPINVAGVPESYVCAGSSITLTATSENGGTLSWDNGITNGVSFVINSTTTYTVSSTSIDDCETSVTITVNDLDPVTPTLSDITAECSTTVSAPTTIDDCSGVITGTTSDPLTYNEQGTYTITWNFDDGEGNDIDVTQKVIINDVTNPTAVAHDTTLYLDAAGNASLTAYSVGSESSDNCSIDTMYLSKYNFDCSDIGGSVEFAVGEKSATVGAATGVVFVWLTVKDEKGNSANDWFYVTIIDTIKPEVKTKDIQIYLDSQGLATINAEDINNGSSDNCGVDNLYISKDSFDGSDLGIQSVSFTAIDAQGNEALKVAQVSINDTIKPSLTIPSDIYVNSDANQCGTQVNYQNEILDISQPSYNTGTVGTFQWQSFRAGNDGLLTKIQLHNNGRYSISFDLKIYEGTGVTGEVIYSNSYSFSFETNDWFDLDWPAEDAPVLIAGNDYTFSLDGDGVGFWSLMSSANPYAFGSYYSSNYGYMPSNDLMFKTYVTKGVFGFDNTDDIEVSQTSGLSTGSVFPVGETTNTFVATDASGNQIEKSFKVTVLDNIKPVASVHDTTLYLNAAGNANLTAASIGSGSTDNCGIDTMYLSNYSFDCSDIGGPVELAVEEKSATVGISSVGVSVLFTVEDGNGNSDSKWFVVTVEDTISPIAVCKDTLLELDSEGQVSLAAEDFGFGSGDACGIDFMTLSTTDFSCEGIGVQKDTLTVTDVNGNSSVCIANVTVEDNIDPIVAAHDTTLFLDADGLAYLTPFSVDNGSADNCGIDTMYLSQDTFDCSDIGIFAPAMVGLKSATGELPPFGVLVGLIAEDGSGNSSYDYFLVTVFDTISPTVETQNITVYLDENGAASIDSSDIDNGSFDNCTIETMSLDSTTFDCDEIGSNSVNLTVTDVNGNSTNKMAYVTVEDTISPTALSHDTTLYLDANGLAFLTAMSVDDESYDNCSIDTMYLSQDTFNCSEVGTLQDTLTVVDGSGNTTISILNVTIEDDIDPTVIAQDTVLYLNSDGIAYLTASFTGPESFDNCSIDTMYLSKDTFDCSFVGYIEQDLLSAEKSASKKDEPEGVTVRLTAVDDNGNSNYTYFKVTVLDSIAPVVFCQDTIIYLDSNGVASIDTSFIFSNSGDACGVADIWLSKSNFNGSNVGSNSITVLASDVNGNVGTCTSNVTVMDTIAPVARCKDIGITLDTEGKAIIYPGFIDDGSTDEGGIVSYSLDITKFYCHDIGEHTVVMSVTDVGGNVSTCSSIVTIADNWLPEVACNDIEVSLGTEGFVVIDSSMIDAGSTALCGISGIELSQSVFTSADLGENSITMTVSNLSGITATCESKVRVKDEIAPVANCNSITVWLSDSASYELSDADLVAISSGSSDNASAYGSLQIAVTPNMFDCSQVGDSVKVEVSITDEAGNESTCEAMVYVKDSSEVLLSSVDDIEINLPAGECETTITYPEVFSSKTCATITQIAGLGAEGIFPAGTTVESWEVSYGEEKDTISFSVIVSAENVVPKLDSLADVIVNEDEGPVVIALSGISAGADCVAQTLSITAENSNSELVTGIEVVYTEGDTTGSISLTLGANQSGTDSISVVVEDSEGAQTEVSFVVTVNPVNDAPYVVTPLPDAIINASYSFELELSAMMGVVFDDVDDDMLEFAIMLEGTDSLPSWVAIEAGVLTATPMIADTGSYSFVVTATDTSGAVASDTFVLEVDGYPTAVEDITAGSFELNLYPNPTKGLVRVETNNIVAEELEIAVMNIAGAEVYRQRFRTTEAIQFNLSDQVSGMYMVLIETDGQRVVKKLILDKR